MEQLKKTITGITGLDEILNGGLPKGRPTLVFGGPGCGKTALGMEFVCRGARQFGEPDLFVCAPGMARSAVTGASGALNPGCP